MSDEPRPEDYPDRINAFIRAHQRWRATQPIPPLKPIPEDLEYLFTPESLERAQAELESVLPPKKEEQP